MRPSNIPANMSNNNRKTRKLQVLLIDDFSGAQVHSSQTNAILIDFRHDEVHTFELLKIAFAMNFYLYSEHKKKVLKN
jgi:hypothetical protein